MPDLIDRRVGGGGHRLPGAGRLGRTADLFFQRRLCVCVQAQHVVGVQRAAHRPHLVFQRLRDDLDG
ncbi:hypothetical protein G6F65_020811 [Rhizopus arrhizus]|nr:hypothetical protein G6F65_020811 [Rhizopus arrhizus]